MTAPSRRLRYKGTARLNRLEWQGALVDERNALRMERDAAHEECARLTAERDRARDIAVALEQGLAHVRYPCCQHCGVLCHCLPGHIYAAAYASTSHAEALAYAIRRAEAGR